MTRWLVGSLGRLMGDHSRHPLLHKAAGLMLRFMPGQITCAEFESFVFDYHEGHLDARTRRLFETHLEICPMCRTSFEGYRRSLALGQRLFAEDEAAQTAPVDAELAAAILAARLRERAPQKETGDP